MSDFKSTSDELAYQLSQLLLDEEREMLVELLKMPGSDAEILAQFPTLPTKQRQILLALLKITPDELLNLPAEAQQQIKDILRKMKQERVSPPPPPRTLVRSPPIDDLSSRLSDLPDYEHHVPEEAQPRPPSYKLFQCFRFEERRMLIDLSRSMIRVDLVSRFSALSDKERQVLVDFVKLTQTNDTVILTRVPEETIVNIKNILEKLL